MCSGTIYTTQMSRVRRKRTSLLLCRRAVCVHRCARFIILLRERERLERFGFMRAHVCFGGMCIRGESDWFAGANIFFSFLKLIFFVVGVGADMVMHVKYI